jgi:hypothetical protein
VARVAAGVVILGVVLAAGVWLLMDSSEGGPDLREKLVDAPALERCLREAPKPAAGWAVAPASSDRNSGASSTEIVVRAYGRLVVYPSEAAAADVEAQASGGDESGSQRWGNVLVTVPDAEPTGAEDDVVHGCLERAAVVERAG